MRKEEGTGFLYGCCSFLHQENSTVYRDFLYVLPTPE